MVPVRRRHVRETARSLMNLGLDLVKRSFCDIARVYSPNWAKVGETPAGPPPLTYRFRGDRARRDDRVPPSLRKALALRILATAWIAAPLSSVKYSWPLEQTSAGKYPRRRRPWRNGRSSRRTEAPQSGQEAIEGSPSSTAAA